MRRQLVVGAAGAVLTCAVLAALGLGPRLLPVGALVLLGVLVVGAVRDAGAGGGEAGESGWPEPPPRVTGRGSDRHLAAYVRMLEGAETADVPDSRTRDELRRLCDARLARRHRLTHADPEARALLGDDLADLLVAPPRRIGRRRLDAHLRRIEAL